MKKILYCLSLILTVLLCTNIQAEAQHRKMSGQAKGAIIGGAGGALAGGLIGHGVKGALIGGAVGAGGGYIIGNEHRRHKAKVRRQNWRAHHTLVRKAKYRYHN